MGAGGGRVEAGGGPQVPQGRTEVVGAAAAVGFAPAQVGQHRVGPEGEGAAEGLDRRGQVAAGQGPVALQEQALIVLFPLDARRRQDGRDAGGEQEDGQDVSAHGGWEKARFIAGTSGTFPHIAGLIRIPVSYERTPDG